MKYFILISILFISTFSFSATSHEEEIKSWRANRLQKLVSEDGWVTLAGLYWLSEGENSFGRAPQNNLIANYKEFPEKMGVFIRHGRDVRFISEKNVLVIADGQPVIEIPLVSDMGGTPTLLKHADFSWFLIERSERIGIRMKWAKHPNRLLLKELPSFPISKTWCIPAQFKPYTNPKKLTIASVIGTKSEEDCPGEIHLQIKGQDIILYPTGSRDSLGLMFGDTSNGKETYAGGRFLPVPIPDAQGNLILDFNLAYNPPCVFTPFATCPMPIAENIMTIAVESGEKMIELYSH